MKIKTPEENVEYTFIIDTKKIYGFTLVRQLPNGRYQFRCRLINGRNTSWLTDMDGKRFSYLYRFNRDKFLYPDRVLEVHPLPQKEEPKRIIEKKQEEQEKNAYIKNKEISSKLFALSVENKNIALEHDIHINELSRAVLGLETENYPNTLSGAIKYMQDLKKIQDMFNIKIL